MPLVKGHSRRTISQNIKELVGSPASAGRNKGIGAVAKKRKIGYEKAKQIQAEAIAYSTAKKFRGA